MFLHDNILGEYKLCSARESMTFTARGGIILSENYIDGCRFLYGG